MTRLGVSLLAAVACAAAAAGVFAEQGPGSGRGRGAGHGRMWNPATVETVRGEIVKVDRVPSPGGAGGGVHLTLKTATETIAVHLGPDWYVTRDRMALDPKDEIEVNGSRVTVDGKPAIIAAVVRKGSATLVLRASDGVPAWSGGGRARP